MKPAVRRVFGSLLGHRRVSFGGRGSFEVVARPCEGGPTNRSENQRGVLFFSRSVIYQGRCPLDVTVRAIPLSASPDLAPRALPCARVQRSRHMGDFALSLLQYVAQFLSQQAEWWDMN